MTTTSILIAIIALTFPLLHLLGILSSIEVLFYAQSSQGAIAWSLFLTFFPYLGLPIYWIFGRSKFHGYNGRIARVAQHKKDELAWYRDQFKSHTVYPEDPELDRATTFARIAESHFLGGNDVDLLIDGTAFFDSLFASIDAAQSFVLIEFFIVKDDEIGREFKERLLAARARGVKVLFLYDEMGSHSLPTRYLDDLRIKGVEVSQFGTRRGGLRNFFQVNFRNHRKIVVVDGQVGFIGGHNIGDEYIGRDPKFGHWRDTHIKITGPGVIQLKAIFFSDWVWATSRVPDVPLIDPTPAGSLAMLTLPSGPADQEERCILYFLHLISSARSRVWISSPYFIPDEALIAALELAALRGIDVRFIIPAKKDHLLVWLASFFFVPLVTTHGIKVYRYKDGFLHQKAALVDDLYGCVGSANFDNRSFRLNFEATSIVADRGFAQKVEAMLEEDMANSRLIPQDPPDKLPLWKQLGCRIARLFSPIL